jgi:hypothetical protein
VTYFLARRLGDRARLIVVLAAVLAMLPDLIPAYQTMIENNWSDLYRWTHTFQWWMVPVFPWGLHVGIDWLVHNHVAPYGWNDFGKYLEGFLWGAELVWLVAYGLVNYRQLKQTACSSKQRLR